MELHVRSCENGFVVMDEEEHEYVACDFDSLVDLMADLLEADCGSDEVEELED